MGRPCRGGAVPTSGGHPEWATLISRSTGPDLGWGQKRQMALATYLVGRVSELDSVDRLLAQVGGGGSATLELVGEPGIGKTRLLAELAARADAREYLVLSGPAVGARARPAVLDLRRRARRVRPRPRSTPPRKPRRRYPGGARDGLPFTDRPRDRAQDRDPARALPQPPRRLRTARDARAAPAGGARAR